MQDTRIYRLLFHLPFFNLFRSYLLLLLFGIFAVLVMSGYGMDALLTLAPAERRRLLCQASLVRGRAGGGRRVVFGWLLSLPDTYTTLPRSVALRHPVSRGRLRRAGLGRLSRRRYRGAGCPWSFSCWRPPQAMYQVQVYRILGIPVRRPSTSLASTRRIGRRCRPCRGARPQHAHAQALRAFRGMLSLDPRHGIAAPRPARRPSCAAEGEAVFQPGLARPVVEALSAVGHPIFWTSRGMPSLRR